MTKSRFLSAFLLFSAVSGCSVHPLPEDYFSPRTTVDIVEQIRCETSAGVLDSGIPPGEYGKHHIGYDFTLDMLEFNKLENGQLELTELLTGGSLKLAFRGGVEKTRQNKRYFRLTETFQHLIDTTRDKCGPAGRRDFVYPIAGRIGIDEIVTTYGRLGRLSGFTKQSDKGNVVFSDTITFTTTITGGVHPTLTLAPKGSGMRVTGAAFNNTNQRKDLNMVVVAVAPDLNAGFGSDERAVAAVAQTRILIATPQVSRAAQIPGNPAATVINELDRIRAQEDSLRLLQQLRTLP